MDRTTDTCGGCHRQRSLNAWGLCADCVGWRPEIPQSYTLAELTERIADLHDSLHPQGCGVATCIQCHGKKRNSGRRV